MQSSKKKNNNSIVFKFLFILIMSNASMYILAVDNQTYQKDSSYGEIKRIDYIEVKIKAKLHTRVNSHTPVKIINKRKNIIVKNAFVLEKLVSSPEDTLINQNLQGQNEFIVYVHKSDSQKFYNETSFDIYPKDMKVQLYKSKVIGAKYEINY